MSTARARLLAAAVVGLLVAGCGTGSAVTPSRAGDPAPASASGSNEAGSSAVPSTASPAESSSPPPAADETSAAGPSSPPRSSVTASSPSSSPSVPAAVQADSCAALVDRLGSRDRIGQLLMAAAPSTGIDEQRARTLLATRVGSVVLLGNTDAGRRGVLDVSRALQQATRRPAGVELLLAVDQEGGLVQRLRGSGFSTIPSAAEQSTRSPASVGRSAATWGAELRRAGVRADLAPVADVVPENLVTVNEPIGRLDRGYGSDPGRVGQYVSAVVGGLHRADVATALKHFPGLGEVRGNTDTTARVVDRTTTLHDASLASFAAGVAAGTDMVMISSATYARIDPDQRAAYSSIVIEEMLRDDLGFAGVVISDDLTAPGVREQTAGERVLRFLRAGGDLAIVSDPDELRGVVRAIRAAVQADPAFAAQIDQKVQRVVALKAARGLATC